MVFALTFRSKARSRYRRLVMIIGGGRSGNCMVIRRREHVGGGPGSTYTNQALSKVVVQEVFGVHHVEELRLFSHATQDVSVPVTIDNQDTVAR